MNTQVFCLSVKKVQVKAWPMEKLNLNCPVCRQPLRLGRAGNGVLVWCSYGPCVSNVANMGAIGEDSVKAYRALLELLDVEVWTWNP